MRRLGGPLGVWRLGVLLLAVGFWAHSFALEDLADFGWQFRYLAIWALSLGIAVGALAVRSSLVPDAGAPESLLLLAAGVSGAQAIVFWWFWLGDPAAVATGGATDGPVRLVYLHAVMPALIWIEAVVLSRAARGAAPAAVWLLVVLAAYMLWIEAGVAPLNPAPAGVATSGLPYPLLNEMTQGARAGLYVECALLALALVLLARWAAGRAAAYSASAARSAASPSR